MSMTTSAFLLIFRHQEQIVNKTFVKMMDELGYDVELTYKKKCVE